MATVVLGLFLFAYQKSTNLAYAQTVALLTIVFSELYQTLSTRSLEVPLARENLFKNKWIFLATAVSAAACFLVIYHPGLQVLFNTVPLSLSEVVMIALISSAGAIYIETAKHLRYRKMVSLSRLN
jgi:Ca2+-transporting ATPase